MAPRPTPRRVRGLGCLALAVLLGLLGVAGVAGLRRLAVLDPVPGEQRCVATAGGSSVAVDPEQARYAAIIVGVSVRRGLPPRAASIALATAYQETGIRNLDYGDRDSVGLFQQRPSQGWGTVEELLDPHYATRAFYDALVRVRDWETRDITEVAQEVQRSGFPEAYRDHEGDGRILASVLTGRSIAGFTCLDRSEAPGDPAGLRAALRETFGRVPVRLEGSTLTIEADSRAEAWAYAHFAVAYARTSGVVEVRCSDRGWTADRVSLPAWTTVPEPLPASTVSVRLR